MLTDDEIAFLRARLDEDECSAKAAASVAGPDWHYSLAVTADGPTTLILAGDDEVTLADTLHRPDEEIAPFIARHDPARALRDVAVWRRLLLDYSIPPGTDAAYGGTERETGFRLALSAALKAKIATYDGNPVTGEPYPANSAQETAPVTETGEQPRTDSGADDPIGELRWELGARTRQLDQVRKDYRALTEEVITALSTSEHHMTARGGLPFCECGLPLGGGDASGSFITHILAICHPDDPDRPAEQE